MQTIWYFHGAGASPHSFNWLRPQLPDHVARFLSYTAAESAESIIRRCVQAIEAEAVPVMLIGHSFGGVLARAVAGRCSQVTKLVTLCAPFGGLKHMGFVSLFDGTPMFRELSAYSSLLLEVRTAPLTIPHLAIVASHGLPLMQEANDGVVTLASQTALRNQPYVEIPLNHFEVLLSPQTVSSIIGFVE